VWGGGCPVRNVGNTTVAFRFPHQVRQRITTRLKKVGVTVYPVAWQVVR